MTEAQSLDTPSIRHGPPSRRVFEDSSAIAWEAVAAWDQAPDGAFHTPRVLFRSLDDPEAPYVLGPALPLDELNDRELRSLLLRARPDETAKETPRKRARTTETTQTTRAPNVTPEETVPEAPEAEQQSPEVTPRASEPTPEPPEATPEPVVPEAAAKSRAATGESAAGAKTEPRKETATAATTPEPEQAAADPEGGVSRPEETALPEERPAQPEEGAREPDELHSERAMAAPQADASATAERRPGASHDRDASRSGPVTDAASEKEEQADRAPEDPEIDAMGMAVGTPGEWLPPLDGDFDIVEGELGLTE